VTSLLSDIGRIFTSRTPSLLTATRTASQLCHTRKQPSVSPTTSAHTAVSPSPHSPTPVGGQGTDCAQLCKKQAYPGAPRSPSILSTETIKYRLTTPHARQAALSPDRLGPHPQRLKNGGRDWISQGLYWASPHTILCRAVEPRHRWCPLDFSHSTQLHTTTSLFPTLPPTSKLQLTSSRLSSRLCPPTSRDATAAWVGLQDTCHSSSSQDSRLAHKRPIFLLTASRHREPR
jgi:hypothetical protein